MENSIANSFLQLKDKKIIHVEVHGINSVSLKTEDGNYRIEIVCVLPNLGLYGMEVIPEDVHESKLDLIEEVPSINHDRWELISTSLLPIKKKKKIIGFGTRSK
jgi:hypothetical protein